MNSFIEMIIQQLEGPLVTQISQRLGVDPQKATQIVAIAVPILISVLTHQKGDLGANQSSVTQGISQAAGISPQQAQQLVSIVTPALKGKLGEHPDGTVQQAASEHTKQIAPALATGDHQSIVNAIASLGQKVFAGVPANRLF